MTTLKQLAVARAGEIIDSDIGSQEMKDTVRGAVSRALELMPFDEALAQLRRDAEPRSGLVGGARVMMARVVNALDTRWLMAQAARSD